MAVLRILVVEDVPANRKIVRRSLSKRGHDVTIAVNGREGVDAFRKGQFDLVLMDIQMPIMDGLQATEAIREIEQRRRVKKPLPIIALTAHPVGANRDRCLRAGMNHYLSKPIDVTQLIQAVEAAGDASSHPDGSLRDLVDAETSSSFATTPPGVETPAAAQEDGNYAKTIDLSSALTRLRGDQALLLELIDLFNEDYGRLLREIRDGIENHILPKVCRAAHNLKGLAATFDAHSAAWAADRIETAARGANAEEAAEYVGLLETEIHCLGHTLANYRENNRQS